MCAKIRLKHGADLRALDCMGKTPVTKATFNDGLHVLEALCHQEAPLNLASSWGATLLMYVQFGRSEAERVLATEILLFRSSC